MHKWGNEGGKGVGGPQKMGMCSHWKKKSAFVGHRLTINHTYYGPKVASASLKLTTNKTLDHYYKPWFIMAALMLECQIYYLQRRGEKEKWGYSLLIIKNDSNTPCSKVYIHYRHYSVD